RGERRLDLRTRIRDDPTTPYRPGSRGFGDEGVASRTLPLVEQGVVKQFVYDLQTAGQAGATSTGSASRATTSLPSPDISVLVFEAGDVPLDDLIGSIEDGVMVEEMIGSSQGNVLGGALSGK